MIRQDLDEEYVTPQPVAKIASRPSGFNHIKEYHIDMKKHAIRMICG